MFEALIDRGFQFEFASHAAAILTVDFPEAIEELEKALGSVSIPIEEIVGSGGGETKGTQRLRRALNKLGWPKRNFTVEKSVDGPGRPDFTRGRSRSCFPERCRGPGDRVEQQGPVLDRDLENFKRLHAEGAISLGVIVTRGASLQEPRPRWCAGSPMNKMSMVWKLWNSSTCTRPSARRRTSNEG